MVNQNSENLLDPDFWQSLGMQPIVINNQSPESVKEGLAELAKQVQEAASEITQQQEKEEKQ